ncbi:LOW QUALITY PROTEIN: hypothetical protein Ct61P_11385 [Colletotrichum tofieldiae]|nr:LOW QUALITY PROTEIN: hypothetical protein Ct61P_11385 [Colletotrichum tofieldiae]
MCSSSDALSRPADDAAWCRVWTLANETTDALVPHRHNNSEYAVSVERSARILCFNVMLVLLFPHTRIKPYDVDHADRITELTSVFWQEFKKELDEQESVAQKEALK